MHRDSKLFAGQDWLLSDVGQIPGKSVIKASVLSINDHAIIINKGGALSRA
jgi:hypothetical protein